MSATDAPMCKLCRKAHWARDGCDGKLQERGNDLIKDMRTLPLVSALPTPMAKPSNPGKVPTGRALRRVVKKKGRKKK